MMRVMVTAAEDGEVRDLKRVGGPASPLQGPRHRVAHVEVSLRHVRSQVQLEETSNHSFAAEIERKFYSTNMIIAKKN